MSNTASTTGPAVKKRSRPTANRPNAPVPRGATGTGSSDGPNPAAKQPRLAPFGATVGARAEAVPLLSLAEDRIEVREQFRKTFDPVKIASMSESILERGVIQPIIVYKHDTVPGKYVLIAGERRLRAVQLLVDDGHRIKIPAVVRPKEELYLLQHDENQHREDLSLIERAASLEWFKNHDSKTGEPLDTPLSIAKLAKLLKMDRPTVNQILGYTEWVPEVLALAEKQQITSPRILTKLNQFFTGSDSDNFTPQGAAVLLNLGRQLAHQAESADPMTRDAMITLYNGMETLLADNDLDKAKALANEVDGLTTLPDVRAAVHLFVPPKERGTTATPEPSDSRVTVGVGEGVAPATGQDAEEHAYAAPDAGDTVTGDVDADDVDPSPVPAGSTDTKPIPVVSGTALSDVLKQARVRREGGQSGWIASVVVKWDDGKTEEVMDLSDLLVDESTQGRL